MLFASEKTGLKSKDKAKRLSFVLSQKPNMKWPIHEYQKKIQTGLLCVEIVYFTLFIHLRMNLKIPLDLEQKLGHYADGAKS